MYYAIALVEQVDKDGCGSTVLMSGKAEDKACGCSV